jgi:hypothetical protein
VVRDPVAATMAAGISLLRQSGCLIARLVTWGDRPPTAAASGDLERHRVLVRRAIRDLRLHFMEVEVYLDDVGLIGVGRCFAPERSALATPLDDLDRFPHQHATSHRRAFRKWKSELTAKSGVSGALSAAAMAEAPRRHREVRRIDHRRSSVHDANKQFFRALQPSQLSGAPHPDEAAHAVRRRAESDARRDEASEKYAQMVSSILDEMDDS